MNIWLNISALFTRMLSFALLSYWTVVDLEVVVHEGIIREKPTTKEEARQFLKGVSTCQDNMHLIFLFCNVLLYYLLLERLLSPGYSGSHVSTVGSVVITNLTTGKRLESLDKAEVIYFCSYSTYLIEAVCVQVRIGNAGDPIDMCDQRLLINIFDRIWFIQAL